MFCLIFELKVPENNVIFEFEFKPLVNVVVFVNVLFPVPKVWVPDGFNKAYGVREVDVI